MSGMVSVKTLVIYTLILTIFSLFATAFFETGDIDTFDDDSFSMLSATQEIINQLGDSEQYGNKGVLYIKLVFMIPASILSVLLQLAMLPFLALNYLPPIVSFLMYAPYTVILFFDVILPLIIKLIELIIKGIEAIVPF